MKDTIKKIKEAIRATGFENKVYIAGGYVRDTIMGRESNDLDLVVELHNGGIGLANYLHKHFKTSKPVIFPKFGTAQIVLDGKDIEIVMSRKEAYDFKGRKPVVEFGTIEDDVARRDFT